MSTATAQITRLLVENGFPAEHDPWAPLVSIFPRSTASDPPAVRPLRIPSPHIVREQKEGELWGGALYPPWQTRGNDAALALTVIAVDCDSKHGHHPAEKMEPLLQGLDMSYWMHSTHSGNRRYILPICRPVWPEEYNVLVAWLSAHLGGAGLNNIKSGLPTGTHDPMIRTVCGMNYLPSAKPEAEVVSVVHRSEYGAWDVDDTLAWLARMGIQPAPRSQRAYRRGHNGTGRYGEPRQGNHHAVIPAPHEFEGRRLSDVVVEMEPGTQIEIPCPEHKSNCPTPELRSGQSANLRVTPGGWVLLSCHREEQSYWYGRVYSGTLLPVSYEALVAENAAFVADFAAKNPTR